MIKVWKNDFYRLSKSPVLYGVMVFTFILPFALTMIIRQDINFGVGIGLYGEPTIIAFREISDIIQMGIQYHMGLGIFVAILISVFIGQEYQWNTWQHKWIIGKSRTNIYLSKLALSCIASVLMFLLFQMVVLLFSGQITEIFTSEYLVKITGGLFVYAALGAVICLLSMLIKNNVASIIVCLLYVLFSETIVSAISNIGSISDTVGRFVEFGIRHSVYGMSMIVSSPQFSAGQIMRIIANSLVVILLSTLLGLAAFRKYEL